MLRLLPLALLAAALAAAAAPARTPACAQDPSLGRVAFVRGGSLVVYDFGTCREKLVARSASGPVRFARDGSLRWGTPLARPGPLVSPDGRTRAEVRGSRTTSQSIWVVDAKTRRARRVYLLREHADGSPGPIELRDWSPDGRFLLFAIDPLGSASLAADGLRLRVLDVRSGRANTIADTLGYDDYRAWCGGRLVLVAGGNRIATTNKRLVVAAPPSWRPRPLAVPRGRAWGGLACTPDGAAVAVESQRASGDASFFHVRWSLWLVPLAGTARPLTTPPAGFADASPRWSRDGRSLLFIRERRGAGTLELLRDGRVHPVTSAGSNIGYYGHLGWWSIADWTAGS